METVTKTLISICIVLVIFIGIVLVLYFKSTPIKFTQQKKNKKKNEVDDEIEKELKRRD